MVHALHMFWEPFFGGRLDIWDVWVLQFLVLGTLALQLCLGLLLTWIFARTLHECRAMQTALQRERQTYMTTGVVCSEAPKAFGESFGLTITSDIGILKITFGSWARS